MKKFYVTFGQNHPLRDGYVVIEALDYDTARQAAFDIFGQKFAFIRETDDIERGGFFPAGQFGKTMIA